MRALGSRSKDGVIQAYNGVFISPNYFDRINKLTHFICQPQPLFRDLMFETSSLFLSQKIKQNTVTQEGPTWCRVMMTFQNEANNGGISCRVNLVACEGSLWVKVSVREF